jgi:hypothetical protein
LLSRSRGSLDPDAGLLPTALAAVALSAKVAQADHEATAAPTTEQLEEWLFRRQRRSGESQELAPTDKPWEDSTCVGSSLC